MQNIPKRGEIKVKWVTMFVNFFIKKKMILEKLRQWHKIPYDTKYDI